MPTPGTWIKDPPDPRDYSYKPPNPMAMGMGRAAIAGAVMAGPPTVVDNSGWLTGVLNQSGEGTCTGISSPTSICGWAVRRI